ncbi:uncharacterized protein LOC144594480 [Rhinoraja longicauda]
MEMGFELKWCIFFILFASTPSAQKFMTFECVSPVTGVLNNDTVLPCSLETVGFRKIKKIQLNKDNNSLFTFDTQKGHSKSQGQIELLDRYLVNVSLIIRHTKLSNAGIYHYILQTDIGYGEADIKLVLKVPYSLPKMTLLEEPEESISCETTGYPPAQIHWIVNGETDLTNNSKTDTENTTEGLVKITSKLPIKLSESSSQDNYACSVWNEAEGRYEVKNSLSPSNRETNLVRQRKDKKEKVLTAVYVIVGGLVSGILILGLFQFRKRYLLSRSTTRTKIYTTNALISGRVSLVNSIQ